MITHQEQALEQRTRDGSLRGMVFDVRKFSLQDGPGIRTTVFFKGCPLSCWWCHNPESQSSQPEIMLRENRCIRCGACLPACPEGAIREENGAYLTDHARCTRCGTCLDHCPAEARQMTGSETTVAQVMAEIEQDIPFYDQSGGGMTASGGEPLVQHDFLLALLDACKALEIHTALDTCGYAPWEAWADIRQRVDLFLFDLKLMDSAAHRKYTGVPNELILENLKKLSGEKRRIIVRLPVVPGITDGEENIRHAGAFTATLPAIERVDILPYHPSALGKYERLDMKYRLAEVKSPTDERMQEIAALLESYGLKVKTGG